MLFGLFLLRPDQQKIKDNENQNDGDERSDSARCSSRTSG